MSDVFKNPYNLYYDSELECGVIIYQGHVISTEFRQAHEGILKLIQEYDVKKMLSDNRKMGIINPADQQWIQDEFLPRLRQTGLRYSAILVPRNRLAMLTVEDIVDSVHPKKSMIQYFADIPEAKEWLESIQLPAEM